MSDKLGFVMRKKNIYKSATVGLLEEAVAIVCAFILPRMILVHFGSSCNGIVAAVTQFIGCIALLKSGIGMATKAALYSPLYNHDHDKINAIMSATMMFLRKIALIFIACIIAFSIVYPLVINKEYSWFFVFSLSLIVSLGTFFQYFFGLGNQLLLDADQKNYIVSFIAIINIIFNTLISVICINAGMTIHGVKMCSALVFCTTPIVLYFYVNKKYNLDRSAPPDMRSISKRWDAFGMQVANFVNNNTDIIVASLFLRLSEVSVYTIYFLAINGVKKLVLKLTVGVEAALGNVIAENNKKKLQNSFLMFEFILNYICAFFFSCLIVLVVPFVTIYTRGVTDANYVRYAFGIVACLAELFFCLRLSYTFVVQAKGAFSETKRYYYIEAVINIIISIVLVNIVGLVGVVLGTLVAMIFRTVMFAKYVYAHIVERPFWCFFDRMFFTLISVFVSCSVCKIFVLDTFIVNDYIQLAKISILVGTISFSAVTVIHFIRYNTLFKKSLNVVFSRKK